MSSVTLRSGEVRESSYPKHPDYLVWLEPSPKRVRVVFNDEVVADSTAVCLLYETRHLPVYYFPRGAIDWTRFEPSARSTFCPFKGEAEYWSIAVGGRHEENVLWGYPQPFPEVAGLEGYVAFYWGKMDRWLEEDEEVLVHPRDPHVRIDVRRSRRRVTAVVGGEPVADSCAVEFLYETGLPTRYYFPLEDVRTELLEPSETVTQCPYKGTAGHFSVRLGEELRPDVAWVYRDPYPEVGRIKERICFYDERVDRIAIDGVATKGDV